MKCGVSLQCPALYEEERGGDFIAIGTKLMAQEVRKPVAEHEVACLIPRAVVVDALPAPKIAAAWAMRIAELRGENAKLMAWLGTANDALRKIASCKSCAPGDVVDIAIKGLEDQV